MSSNTKIVVLRSKELVYAIVLIVISILIIMTAVSLFVPKEERTVSPAAQETKDGENETQSIDSQSTNDVFSDIYIPGIYCSAIKLGNANVELQITVDSDHINSITLSNLDEAVSTLYPLMQPTLNELSAAILESQSIESVSYADENRYTSMLLMQAISSTLDKARISENADSPDMGIIY